MQKIYLQQSYVRLENLFKVKNNIHTGIYLQFAEINRVSITDINSLSFSIWICNKFNIDHGDNYSAGMGDRAINICYECNNTFDFKIYLN